MTSHCNERSIERENQLKNQLEIWSDYKHDLKTQFPNISILIMISFVLPLSNAVVERQFSTMNRIHTAMRNSLNVSTVDYLMMISREGRPSHEYKADSDFIGRVVRMWHTLPAHEKFHSARTDT